MMGKYMNYIGLGSGMAVAILIYSLPLTGLSAEGKMAMSLSLMTVVFWAFQIAQAGYISGLYLALLVIFKVAPADVVFSPWIGSTMYLVIGAYLIATAVKSSGLGERIGYKFLLKYGSSYRSVIISIFVLTFILSLLIPHPWPRAFLIMSIMAVVIKGAHLPAEDAAKIGFTVFAASVPISTIFLTGDSVINPLAVEFSGVKVSWIDWFVYMGLPSIVASIITCILILLLFKPSVKISIDKKDIENKLSHLGTLSKTEKLTIVWLVIAVALWMTDFIHGINIGWITLLIAMLMSFPVGGVLKKNDWASVPVQVLLFLSAAITIGKVGAVTGMNTWLAENILPSTLPANPFLFALLITAFSVLIHMVLGSVIAVMGITIPTLLVVTQSLGIDPLIVTLLVFTAISIHYLFPFHHLNILVGQGEENGLYSQKEVMRLGIPLTIVVFLITVGIEIPWWKLLGLL